MRGETTPVPVRTYRWIVYTTFLLGAANLVGCARPPARWVPSEGEIRAERERILRGLASPDCADRRQVVLGGGWFLGGEAGLHALAQALASAAPEVQRRAGLVLAHHKRTEAYLRPGGEHWDWWINTRRRVEKVLESGRPAEVHRVAAEMLSMAKEPSNDLTRRDIAMGEFVEISIKSAGLSGSDIARVGLPAEVLSLLQDTDLDIRGLATANTAFRAKPPADQERLIIGNLIRLLRRRDFGLRFSAFTYLEERTVRSYWTFCVDPTDDPTESEPAIRQWEQRWEAVEAEARRGPAR